MDNRERILVLIEKLKEQYGQGMPAQYMAVTAQMLLAELNIYSYAHPMPGTAVLTAPLGQVSDTVGASQVVADSIDKSLQEEQGSEKIKNRFSIPYVELPEIPFLKDMSNSQVSENVGEVIHSVSSEFDLAPHQLIIEEPKPTFTEVHETLNAEHEPILNEKLKEEKIELAALLKETPIADLRKAIGINDRFVFIQELFNGDETMYERCIKTINSFSTYQEAAGWIQRELKVKLGWKEVDINAQHFDQLVMRRFS